MLHNEENIGRLMVMDNFYARHPLARQVAKMSENDVKVVGTVRFNHIDGIKSACCEASYGTS